MSIPLTVLAILDGFGYSTQSHGNAIHHAKTPNLDKIWSTHPHYLLKAAEEEVGLEFGEIGNSEVGHITIGTGRVIPQIYNRINKSIQDGSFQQNHVFVDSINRAKSQNKRIHLMGIISTAGVHGHLFHFLELMRLIARQGVTNYHLHLILDGRDAGKFDSPMFLKEIEKVRQETGAGIYATVIGRAFSMDRNNNWEITSQAYSALMGRSQYIFPDPNTLIQHFYDQKIDDENIPPCIISNDENYPKIEDGDLVIFSNFREDRARQITQALSLPNFSKFDRGVYPKDLNVVTMAQYEAGLPVQVAYPPPDISNSLSDVLSKNLISQIHIAESEKYAHVSYFFNGGREEKQSHEEFYMVPSLKPDEFVVKPEMSASEITQAVIKSIELGYNFIVFNFANCDMVGHTGDFEAAVKAVEVVDTQVGQIYDKVLASNGNFILTADHGNCEEMIDTKTGEINKKHTIAPVPLIISNQSNLQNSDIKKVMFDGKMNGLLADVAPTILSLLGLESPEEMTGAPLV